MRWFLREGWGALAHYGTGDIVMREATASLLVPCLRPRTLDAALSLQAPSPRRVGLLLNGRSLGGRDVTTSAAETVVRLPAEDLFRGDNVLTVSDPGAPGLHLRRLVLRPAP